MHRPPRSHSYPITGVTCKLRRRVSTLHALSSRVVVRGGAAVLWCCSRAVWTGNWRDLFGLDTSTVSQLGWASARGCHAHVLKNGALFGATVTYHILLRVPTMLFNMTHTTQAGVSAGGSRVRDCFRGPATRRPTTVDDSWIASLGSVFRVRGRRHRRHIRDRGAWLWY